jgi:hypothetical protein
MKNSIFTKLAIVFLVISNISAQEALKSTEEDYYDFLALQGITERPTLNYRTLSDSQWNLSQDANHVWSDNNLGTTFTLWQKENPGENWFLKGINQNLLMKVYGPKWFNSFNTASPYGQNDGALWQGKGYNTSLTAGIRFEFYGIEATIKPNVNFSQNLGFELMTSNYDSEFGYIWGYAKNKGIDKPQRFGDKAFWTFDLGDTEIRYTWKNFTIGFGNQSIWLGPAYINPILHSNNAASYPKLDLGLRKTTIKIPGLNWNIGDIETRIWTGYLSESQYFDNDESNNHNMIHGFTFAYSPSFVKGLTLFANRIALVKWKWENLKYILPLNQNTHIGETDAGEDQKMSFGFNWAFPQVGFELYTEIGLDDFVPDGFPKGYIRYPLHTLAYTAGLKKTFNINQEKQIFGELHLEINNSEMSQDFQFQWPYNFGFHHQITQGYTNKGQLLGTGYGYGGNMQYLDFSVLYPKGKSTFTIARWNPDNNYLYSKAINAKANEDELNDKYFTAFKANFIIGFSTLYYITKDFNINGSVLYNLIINNHYENDSNETHNLYFSLGIEYNI